MDARIDRISRKLREKGRQLGPTLTNDTIRDFEARCGCMLPDGYRSFLQHVGNGGSGPPAYGLLELDQMPKHMNEEELRAWSDLKRVSRPFPFTQTWVWEDGRSSDEGTQDQTHDGNIHLGTDGCAQYWLLIVSGPERGNVWLLADVGVTPTSPRRDFLQWFEDWLDGVTEWWA